MVYYYSTHAEDLFKTEEDALRADKRARAEKEIRAAVLINHIDKLKEEYKQKARELRCEYEALIAKDVANLAEILED